ncbi:MAG TPA: GNAT family N-acetyltransferase [Flavobacterium sp.]|jgi:ribosomal protein S18 acetylase RimI-like enzyme
MVSIIKATADNYQSISKIGNISVAEAHRGSCPDEDLNDYLQRNYNDEAIFREIGDPDNLYNIIYYDKTAIGFSKLILNAKHANISEENVAKLDRIYLLNEFQGLKLGYELLRYNVDLAKLNDQAGIWLYTWIGNEKAIRFYAKCGFKIIGSHRFYVTETSSNVNHQVFLEFSGPNHK